MKTLKILLFSALAFAFAVTSQAQLKVDMTGKVGVATTTPEHPLDVVGNTQSRGGYIFNGKDAATGEAAVMVGWGRTGAGSAAIRFYNTFSGYGSWGTTFGVDPFGAGGLFHQGAGALGIVTQGTQNIQIGVNNASKIFVEGSTGNVGVNTESPDQNFSVNGNASKIGGGSWVGFSDRRLKKDIKPFKDGLEQVLALNPVTFHYNGEAGISDTESEFVGVIAQEIQKVAPYTVEAVQYKEYTYTSPEGSFLPTRELKDTKEYLTVDATAISYMLVNAIKEQQATIESQDELIKSMEERLVRLEAVVGAASTAADASQVVTLASDNTGGLRQNQPNPFDQETLIKYTLPETTQDAVMVFSDSNGRLVKSVTLDSSIQNGELQVHAKELNAGIYTYTLMVDGKVFSTKKMVLTK